MHQSPLILDFYFLKKVQFELKTGFDSDLTREREVVELPKLNINVESGKDTENANHWRFELSVDADENSSEADFPYTFSVTLVGLFRVDESFPAESADMLATVNAPSILYSAAREFLANITGRSPYPAILLPSFSFVPTPKKEVKKKVNSTAKKPTATAKPIKETKTKK